MFEAPIARKPYTTNPTDSYLSVVIHKNFKGEFVTHVHNSSDDGFHSGRYFPTLEEAMKDFNRRGVC